MGKKQGFELPLLDHDKIRKANNKSPRFDPVNLLKPGQTLTRDDSVARSAFMYASQIDQNSPAFQKLEPGNQRMCIYMADIIKPYVCAPLAPQYGRWAHYSGSALYYDDDQTAFVLSFLPIQASKCAGVTRHDLETVAMSVTAAHACAY